MLGNLIRKTRKLSALLLSMIALLSGVMGYIIPVHAADGVITFNSGETISYGSYFTTKMSFDGTNVAYCVEPLKFTPNVGSYEYNLLENDSPVRKALYYLPGGYGYEKNIHGQYLGGWDADDAYVIGHLVVAYIYSGYDMDSGAFHGAPQNFVDKALEVTKAIAELKNPPATFRAFIVPGVDSTQTITGSWFLPPGWIEIKKTSSNPNLSDGNQNYSLAGAKYGIFLGNQQVGTLTTDENGYAKSEDLEEASYIIRELAPSLGYAIDVNSHTVEVKSDVPSKLEVVEVPQNNPLDLLLQKIDAETGEAQPQGAAILKDAEFTVKYYTVQSETDPAINGVEANRTWIFRTDQDGKVKFTKDYLISGDEFYYRVDGTTPCLPLGTVTLEETKEPEGYKKNEKVFVQIIGTEGTNETVNCFNSPTVPEQIYRGDLELVKVSDTELKRLENVPFMITAKSNGENHIIVTDKNGYASTAASWNKHTYNTNEGITSKDGVWFGAGTVDDNKGALPYDNYIIEEQRCEANKGMDLLKFEVSVYKDSVTIDLGTLTDDRIEISTSVKDSDTKSHISMPDKDVTLIDSVRYEGLKKGQEYKLVGYVIDSETGKPILNDGKEITSETKFKAKKTSGVVDVEFNFDGSLLQGKTVVVFEELYYMDELLVEHADMNDTEQMIYFPKISTTASGEEGGKEIDASEQAVIKDIVYYENLIAGQEYRIVGRLMVQETGEELINEEPVMAETTFIAEETSGSIEVTFNFNASALGGKSLVVFEELYYNNKLISEHADITDKGQTVKIKESPSQPGKPSTPPETKINNPPKTGDSTNIFIWLFILIAGGCGAMYALMRHRKKDKEVEADNEDI